MTGPQNPDVPGYEKHPLGHLLARISIEHDAYNMGMPHVWTWCRITHPGDSVFLTPREAERCGFVVCSECVRAKG